jgi:hypothetical protein
MVKLAKSLLILLLAGSWLVACTPKQQSYQSQQRSDSGPSTRDPGQNNQAAGSRKPTQQKKGGLFARNKQPINQYDRLVLEYQQRMEANVKELKKMEKEMKKPQYSDPSYFGHKKKPKKRPPAKRKYCKECGIWH